MRWLFLMGWLASAVLFSGCGGSGRTDQIVIGMELNYPPFEMKDAQGQPIGVSVDMAKALGVFLGKEVVIRDIDWAGIIPALQSGRVDCVISSMTITEERRQSVEFSDPYVETGICLLVQKNGNVNSFEDLNQPGRRIAVKLGTTGDLYAKEHLPKARIDVFTDQMNCALEVHHGRADAFLYDQVSIAQLWAKFPDTTRALLEPVRVERWGIAVRKDDPELLQSINAFLADFRAKGGFEQLGDQWLGQQKESFEKMGVKFVF